MVSSGPGGLGFKSGHSWKNKQSRIHKGIPGVQTFGPPKSPIYYWDNPQMDNQEASDSIPHRFFDDDDFLRMENLQPNPQSKKTSHHS